MQNVFVAVNPATRMIRTPYTLLVALFFAILIVAPSQMEAQRIPLVYEKVEELEIGGVEVKGVKCKVRDTDFRGSFADFADRFDTVPMAEDPGLTMLFGPPAIAIHDDSNVLG